MSRVNSSTLAPSAALGDFRERAIQLPYVPVALPEPGSSPTQFLSPVERATVRVEVLPYEELPLGNSVLHEIAVRLAGYEQRDILKYMSGYGLAGLLQYIYHPASRGRWSRRGWIMLAALDAADIGAEVYIDAEPLPGSRHSRKMRLSARLAEIENGFHA